MPADLSEEVIGRRAVKIADAASQEQHQERLMRPAAGRGFVKSFEIRCFQSDHADGAEVAQLLPAFDERRRRHIDGKIRDWLSIGERRGAELPRIFQVNWFRKQDGRFLWPGFGENVRVLQWVFERCAGRASGRETPIGTMPRPRDLELWGLSLPAGDLETLLDVDVDGWLHEVPLIREYYAQFGVKPPAALGQELDRLEERLRAARG